ncbi:hypothetical protein AGIG_G17327 [Arapaima gigas]
MTTASKFQSSFCRAAIRLLLQPNSQHYQPFGGIATRVVAVMSTAPTSSSLQLPLWQIVEALGAAAIALLSVVICAGFWHRFRSWTIGASDMPERQDKQALQGVYNTEPTKGTLCRAMPPAPVRPGGEVVHKVTPQPPEPLYENVGMHWATAQTGPPGSPRTSSTQHVPDDDDNSIYLNDSINIYCNYDRHHAGDGRYEEDYIFPDEQP